MTFFERIKNNVTDAVDVLMEKNRIHAQINRIRLVMRTENDAINRNFIALGKYYYDNLRDTQNSENEEICTSIDAAKIRVEKAKERYQRLLELQTAVNIDLEEDYEFEDLTVACSNEEEYADMPLAQTSDTDDSVIAEVAPIIENKSEDLDAEVADA
ncbi:MAG: hypothetical protein Q8876_00805 [Bacillota bacterium]|nr:hypothetical protein [Bacillota bacterium]